MEQVWIGLHYLYSIGKHLLDPSSATIRSIYCRSAQRKSQAKVVAISIHETTESHDVFDSFAWRVGGGIDYVLSKLVSTAPKGIMLNMETAWKRSQASADFSTLGLLGVHTRFKAGQKRNAPSLVNMGGRRHFQPLG